jgi:hypothetical protein
MTGGGKHPHKAYCEKHSMEQKAKAESQKHGAEELKSLKHYRVGVLSEVKMFLPLLC